MRRGAAVGGGKENANPDVVSPSPSKADSSDAAADLKKELANATAGRAEMELEYMNLLSSIESEKRAADELLERRTKERDLLKGEVEELEAVVKNLKGRVDGERDDRRMEVERLREEMDRTAALLDEKGGQLRAAQKALKAATENKDGSSASKQETALLLQQVKGAMSRLDEETARFQKESKELQRQRDEARKKAQHEEEAAAQSRSAVADLEAQMAKKENDIAALQVAVAKSHESSVSQQEAAVLRKQVEAAMKQLDTETTRFQKEKESLRIKMDEADKSSERSRAEVSSLCTQIETKNNAIKELQKSLSMTKESSVSQQEVDVLREQVEGAVRRLDEETAGFQKEKEDLHKQRDYAERSAARSEAEASDLRAQISEKDKKIEDLETALAESNKSSVSLAEAAVLRDQVEDAMKRLDEESIRFQKEKESLCKQRDDAKKSAQKEEAVLAESQSVTADLQARIVVKDREIESLKGTLAKSREYSDALKAETKELSRKLEVESERAEDMSQELEAIHTVRSLSRAPPPNIEQTLERERQHAADREEIDRLNALIAERDGQVGERDAEVEALQQSLRDSIEQSEILMGEVRRLQEERRSEEDSNSPPPSVAETKGSESSREEMRELRARWLESEAMLESMERSAAEANARNGELEAEVEELRAQLAAEASRALSSEDGDLIKEERAKADKLRLQVEKKREENMQLKSDLEDLCESMKDLASARREEMDEVQSQISRRSHEVEKKEKEIELLKVTLKEQRLTFRNELDMYKARVRSLEPSPEQESTIVDLRRANSHLQSQLASQTVEADKLRARVHTLLHSGDSSRVVEVLRSRNEALKQEAARWRRKYDGLENSIKRVSV